MTLARFQKPAQDNAGNLITASLQVTVRNESSGALARLYSDRDGTDQLGNPFTITSGIVAFHVAGGAYRVQGLAAGGASFDWRYQAVGTAQEQDADAYRKAGFTWAPESSTSSPPSSGCIRFNNADVSLATHIYVHATTLGNTDATKWLTNLTAGDWLLGATPDGVEVGWPVTAVTNHTTWFDITIDQTQYAGPAGPLSFSYSGYVNLARQPSAGTISGALTVPGAASGSAGLTLTGGYVDLSGANAGQVKFPGTQNPSSNVNTLDDYEEGTWTPTLKFGGASTGITYGTPRAGRYTKIGRTVFATCSLALSSKGSATGTATIAGLPFTSLNDGINNSCAVGLATSFSSVTGAVIGVVAPNAAEVTLYQSNGGAASALTNSNFAGLSTISLSVVYDAQ